MADEHKQPRTPGIAPGRDRDRWRAGLVLAALIVVLGVAFWLRAQGGIKTFVPFDTDAALHLRMTERALEGRLHEIDSLRLHPIGVHVERVQPTGLYESAAWFHRLVAPWTGRVETSVRVFTALSGALLTIPVFLAARRLWRSTLAGLVAAAAIAVMPAHALRTTAWFYRFDAPGTLLLGVELLVIVRALESKATRGRWLLPAAAGLSQLLLCAVWRAGVGLFVVQVTALAILVALGAPRARVALIVSALLAGFLLAGVMPYFRAQGILISRVGTVGIWLSLATCALALVRNRLAGRGIALSAGGVALGAALLLIAVPRAPFDAGEAGILRVITGAFAPASTDMHAANLYRFVRELAAPGVSILWDREILSWTSVPIVLGVAYAIRRKARSGIAGSRMAPGGVFVALFGTACLVMALFVERTKVFAAIPFAVASGGVAIWAQAVPTRLPRIVLVAIVTAALAATALGTATIARANERYIDFALHRMCEDLKRVSIRRDGVLCDWDSGYSVQTYAGQPTFTDGHLELPLNRQRIREVDEALVSQDMSFLVSLCRENAIRYVLYHDQRRNLPFIRLGLAPPVPGTAALPPGAATSTVFKLDGAGEVAPFTLVSEGGGYRLFELEGPR